MKTNEEIFLKEHQDFLKKEQKSRNRQLWVIGIMIMIGVFFCKAEASPVLTTSWHNNIKDRLIIPTSPILCESGEDISHSINKNDYDNFLHPLKKTIELLNSFETGPSSIFDVNYVVEHTNYSFVKMKKSKISVCLSKKEVEEILKKRDEGVGDEADVLEKK